MSRVSFVIQGTLFEIGLVATLREVHRLKAQFDEYFGEDFDAISTYVSSSINSTNHV